MSAPTPAAKIGVFNSGLGGLSVLQQIHRLLPDASTLYIADQAHVPYGPRPAAEIDVYVDAVARFMLDAGARVIVLACHSASAASLQGLRRRYPDVPFVGIEPAVKPAAGATRTGVVAVLTTQVTADGPLYRRVLSRFASDVQVLTRVAPELVTLVEAGEQDMPSGRATIRGVVAPLCDAGADHIVLACTHFSFLAERIAEVAGPGVTLVDPAPAVARQTARLWHADTSSDAPSHLYLTTGAPAAFAANLRRLTGVVAAAEQARWHDDGERGRWHLSVDGAGRGESVT